MKCLRLDLNVSVQLHALSREFPICPVLHKSQECGSLNALIAEGITQGHGATPRTPNCGQRLLRRLSTEAAKDYNKQVSHEFL